MPATRASDRGGDVRHRPAGACHLPLRWQRQHLALLERRLEVRLLDHVLRADFVRPQPARADPPPDRLRVATRLPRSLRNRQHRSSLRQHLPRPPGGARLADRVSRPVYVSRRTSRTAAIASASGRVAAEEGEAGPRRELVPDAGIERDRLPAGLARQVRRDRVVPARRQDVHERRQHEEDPGEGRDAARGVADDRAEAEREQADHGQVERAADDRARDARVGERDLEDVVPREDRLAREEARSAPPAAISAKVTAAKTAALAQSTGRRFGTAVNVDADHPRRVLARDHEHAEHPDRELRELTPASATSSGCRCARSRRAHVPQWDEVTSEKSTGKTIVSSDRRRAATSASSGASAASSTRRARPAPG